jgi:hypothetical protein
MNFDDFDIDHIDFSMYDSDTELEPLSDKDLEQLEDDDE